MNTFLRPGSGSYSLALRGVAALCLLGSLCAAQAATALADQPISSSSGVPGNVVFPLSVEYPTAVGVANQDTTYSSSSTYLGYFDPTKCYVYKFVDVETSSLMSHFAPAAVATSHTCGGANAYMWSGNFMNWATMQTIDSFRWAMTGGYRVVDTASLTLLEKAWASGQDGTALFPDRTTSSATDIAGATPFAGTAPLISYVQGRGQLIALDAEGNGGNGGLLGTYFNTMNLDATGATPVLTRAESVNFNWGSGSPKAGVVNSDYFSARWVASDPAPSTGNYRFQTVSDDGVRLWINGTLVIDNWTPHGPTTDTSATIALTAGAPLSVRLEYFEQTGGAQIQLLWLPPGASSYSVYTGRGWPYLPARAKVCDATAPGGVEANCKAYANGYYKPEGLMQQYANRMRYGVFSYLNDSNLLRDAGVLRTQQKFIGPTSPVPGSTPQTNTAAEWDATTGVQVANPDSSDASATSTALGITISNSGALNYINKFGEITRGNYKSNDPVSELYYASLRYYENLGNVPAWSDMSGASTATKTTWADSFPVITTWRDPIQYTCQRNFILGIGDVNTHADRNVPGGIPTPGAEPPLPSQVTADTAVNATTATNQVGVMQSLGANLAATHPYSVCCQYDNSPLIAGLAYDANTRDIRSDLANVAGTIGQTVQTYWVDVMQSGIYLPNNQFYLAAKYGGFRAPSTFSPYAANAALQDGWWHTTTDTVGSGTSAQPRPDNYFTAGRPDLMLNGLTQAFASISTQLKAYTTSFSTALPQVAGSGVTSYSTQYDASTWTGEITASSTSFDASSGNPTVTPSWWFSNKLSTQLAGSGWDTGRNVVTWNPTTAAGVPFRIANITAAQKTALDSGYRSGDDSADYLNYLRGDRSQEQNSTVSGSSKAYRTRSVLVGDIVDSKLRVVGPPSAPYASAPNPGYPTFKSTWANRATMLYVGTNAGLLHAVNGALSGTGAGQEVFAYVPAALFQGPTATPQVNGLASLGNPSYVHHNMVDGSAAVFDIDFGRTPGGGGTTDWHSVLVGALGKGGKSYYAIDVTDPSTMTTEAAVAGKVLWEFSDPALGYTYSEPAAVKTKQYGWVLIFGSGYNNSDGKGYFFIVNPKTGALLQKISTGVGSSGSDAGLAYVQAFLLDRTDGTADAVYAGDLLGNLWRLDVTGSGTYPAPVQLAVLSDASGNTLPVTSRPLVVVQPVTNRRYVTVGTGRLLDSSDVGNVQSQAFFAIIDGTASAFATAASPPLTGISFPIGNAQLKKLTDLTQPVALNLATQLGWWVDLGANAGAGWRSITDPVSFYGVVAFTAMQPTSSDPCTAASRVYAIDLGSGQSRLLDGGTITGYLPALPGVAKDLRFYSVDGTARLIGGNDSGAVKSFSGSWGTTPGTKRLNWRELQLAD